jgi:cobalt-zinc-cadmium efflux system outer membrane protein
MFNSNIRKTDSGFKWPVAATLLLVLTFPVRAQQTPAFLPSDPVLTSLIVEGQANSPALLASREQVRASEQHVPQAGAWADPTLAFGATNLPVNTFSLNQEPMTATWITVGQAVPLTHRYGATKTAAMSLAEASRQRLLGSEFELGRQIAATAWDCAYLHRSVNVVDSTLGLLDDLISITQTKYETGRGLQQDILRLQTERTKLADRRALLAQQAGSAARRVMALIGSDPETTTNQLPVLPEQFPALDSVWVHQRILSQNPRLGIAKQTVMAMNEKEKSVRAMRVPDLKLSAGYGIRQNAANGTPRPDFLTLTAGISVPLFAGSKQNRAIDESRANLREANQNLHSEELNVRLEAATLLDEDRRLAQQVDYYEQGVIPQAFATLAAATASYAVGKVDVEAILSAETALINARLELYARFRDRAKTRAALAALAGSPELTGSGSTITE